MNLVFSGSSSLTLSHFLFIAPRTALGDRRRRRREMKKRSQIEQIKSRDRRKERKSGLGGKRLGGSMTSERV